MLTANQSDKGAHETTLVLRVRYAPVKAPMVDPHASPGETLAQVKIAALQHFKLTEGPVAGGSKTYQLSFDDVVQTDLSVTLNDLVERGHGRDHDHDHDRKVELLLIEQFVQG